MLQKGDLFESRVTDMNYDGTGVTKEKGLVVFIKGAVPGDEIKGQILKAKKNYAVAKLVEIISPSELRTKPRCEHFGTCNGCKTQNIDYEAQLNIKRKHVADAFERIGGFKVINIPEVAGSEQIYFYRNKLEFSFSNNRWINEGEPIESNQGESFVLGYHMPNFVDKVLDIKNCYLQSEISNKILSLTRDFFKKKNTSIYSFKTHIGFLRYLVIRSSHSTGEILINLITSSKDNSLIDEYANCLKDQIPEVATLTNSISTTKAQAAKADYYEVIFGNGSIEEQIGKKKFKITPNIFFQTNPVQAKTLFDIAANFAQFSGEESVLDLYCGCGTISIYISDFVKNVTGVESNKEAVAAARENSEINLVRNAEFTEFDVKDYLKFLITNGPFQYDAVILDPPRSGIHPKAGEYLLKAEPKKIIYVSCNPATQARDLKILAEKYDIGDIQPVDMFPHTMHTENVVSCKLKAEG